MCVPPFLYTLYTQNLKNLWKPKNLNPKNVCQKNRRLFPSLLYIVTAKCSVQLKLNQIYFRPGLCRLPRTPLRSLQRSPRSFSRLLRGIHIPQYWRRPLDASGFQLVVFVLVWTRGPIHRHCLKICLQIRLKTIARQKLRYPKIILQHLLSEFTKLALSDHMICHKIARFFFGLKTGLHLCPKCSLN